jgi:DNA-binding transcriptional regulator YhcF (GntR family)
MHGLALNICWGGQVDSCYKPIMAKAKHTSPENGLPEILQLELSPQEVDYKQITRHMRGLILSKALVAGTRLPTLTELTKLWNASYCTVQTALTPLVNEGLLTRHQRRGTLVAENTRQIKTVGIYSGSSFWRIKPAAFYQTLYDELCEHFENLGIGVHLFVDSRLKEEQGTPWKPLSTAIDRSEVNAVVSLLQSSDAVSWLGELPIPVGMLTLTGPRRCQVHFQMDNFLRDCLVRLKERKCRSVALICGGGLPDFDSFFELAAEIGLKCRPEWVCRRSSWPEDFEDFGIESFAEIWSGATKPDGLIIYPDNIALGVIIGILQHGVRVPEDLKLVLHCNEEVYFPCPMPADWQVVSIGKIVAALWENLRAQADGKSPRTIAEVLSMHPASPDSPPLVRKWSTGKSQFVPQPEKISSYLR